MKTTDLIDMMAQENQAHMPSLRAMPPTLIAAAIASFVLLLLFWGIRPDLLDVIDQPLVLIKYALPVLTAIPCFWLVSKARHPDTALDGKMRWLAVPVALLAVLVMSSLASLPSEAWITTIKGDTLFACMCSIPVLATPILAALLWLMRGGASSHPATAGALAGLASGCLASSIYALHCYEDNPAFYGLWYTLAIALMTIAGQQLGKRLLKW